jgi:hypothetical protein
VAIVDWLVEWHTCAKNPSMWDDCIVYIVLVVLVAVKILTKQGLIS